MAHAGMIASKLSKGLNETGHECRVEDEGVLLLPKWDLQVEVAEGQEQAENGTVAIMTEVFARHRLLPKGYARELAVGLARSHEDAAGTIAAGWLLLFLPPLKFLFEEHPHDCFVHEEPVDIPHALGLGYRLLAGPVQSTGFDADDGGANPVVRQTVFWDALRDVVTPHIGHGVHHVRCYTCRTLEGVEADVFLDAEEWPEGSDRLRRIAEAFPAPTDVAPIYALKQHLIIRPDDLEDGLEREQAERARVWSEALRPYLKGRHAGELPQVLRALFVMSRRGSPESHEGALLRAGVPAMVASRLVTFLPSAAVRASMGGRVKFPDTYLWTNHEAQLAVERRYDETGIFTAADEILSSLRRAGLAEHEILAVAGTSAEMRVILQAMEKGAKPESLRLTMTIHQTDEHVDGEDLNAIVGRMTGRTEEPRKPWWKFW